MQAADVDRVQLNPARISFLVEPAARRIKDGENIVGPLLHLSRSLDPNLEGRMIEHVGR